jgi:hypothetical protein
VHTTGMNDIDSQVTLQICPCPERNTTSFNRLDGNIANISTNFLYKIIFTDRGIVLIGRRTINMCSVAARF